jgi:hypothetical protein
MKNINKYVNLAEYTADTSRPTNESTVSSIDENKVLKFEGKNVIVDKAGAEVGDIAVYDKNTLTKRFVKFSTYQAPLPTNLVVGGVVYYRTTDKVHIVAKDQYTEKWGAPYQVKMTGFDFTTGGEFSITINTTTTSLISYLTSDTLSSVAAKIMSALTASGFTSATGWSVTSGATYIVVQQDFYTPNVTIFNVADATLKIAKTILTGNYQTALSGLLYASTQSYRKDGSVTSNAGFNYLKYLQYYEVSGTSDTNLSVGSTTTIKRSMFNAIDNPLLFAYYKTYEAYIVDKILKYPYSKGAVVDEYGKLNTDKLSAVMYTNALGVSSPAYPAANMAKTYGIVDAGFTTGFEPGNWWLPSSPELFRLIRNVTWGASGIVAGGEDIVNRALTLIGGTRVSAATSMWSSSELSNINAWYSNGFNGSLLGGIKPSSVAVRGVTAF